MKKFTYLLMVSLLLLAGTFSSCEKVVEDLQNSVEVTIYTDLSADLLAVPDVTKDANGSATFSETAIIDINQNEDLEDYLDGIESIEVTSVKIKITSVSKDGLVLENGTFTIKDNITEDAFEFSTPANLPLALDTEYSLPTETAGWDIVNKIIASMHSATVSAVGTVNDEAFEIGFNYVISVKVKAKP